MALDETAARSVPGLIAVVRDGNFLAVAAERGGQAIAGRNALALGARWSDAADTLPDISNLAKELRQLRSETSAGGTAGSSRPRPPPPQRGHAEDGPSV